MLSLVQRTQSHLRREKQCEERRLARFMPRKQNSSRQLQVQWRWARVFRKSICVYPSGSRMWILARALKDSSVICSQKKAKAASTFTVRTGLKSHWASTKPAYCCACGRVDGQLRPVRSNPNQTHQRSLAASCWLSAWNGAGMYVGPLPIRAYVSVHASCQSSLRAALARCVHMLRAVVTARSAISKSGLSFCIKVPSQQQHQCWQRVHCLW